MANDNEDKQAQINALQATVARLEEQIAAMQRALPSSSLALVPPVQQHVQQQIATVPPNLPPVNEELFHDAFSAQPSVQVAPNLDQAAQDKLAKVDQLEDALRKSKNFKDHTFDLEELLDGPKVKLPDRFKMPKIDRFDGTGNPKGHVHFVVSTLQPLGLSLDQIAVLFPRTLTASARDWYFSLEPSIVRDCKSMFRAFMAQYEYNQMFDITLRDLEITRQEPNESFSDFLTRWRTEAAKMISRPSESEQVRMVIKNLQSEYLDHLAYTGTDTFDRLKSIGQAIEDNLQSERIRKRAQAPKIRRPIHLGDHSMSEVDALTSQGTPSAYDHSEVSGPPSKRQKRAVAFKRKRAEQGGSHHKSSKAFSDLGQPLSEIFEQLLEKRLIEPLEPRPLPNPIPRRLDLTQYCAYHQRHGHSTDRCLALRHAVQSMIDDNVYVPV